jgi:hypothetical protein
MALINENTIINRGFNWALRDEPIKWATLCPGAREREEVSGSSLKSDEHCALACVNARPCGKKKKPRGENISGKFRSPKNAHQ